MKTGNHAVNEFNRIMNCIILEEEAKNRIIKNCARYGTLQKIRSGKFTVTAVIKEKNINY